MIYFPRRIWSIILPELGFAPRRCTSCLASFSKKMVLKQKQGTFKIQIDGDLFKAMIYIPKS